MRKKIFASPHRGPELSIVIAARNDDYGKDFLSRLRIFVRSVDYHASRHPGKIELEVVEWNPPDDRPALAATVEWPGSLSSRIITVPRNVHQNLAGPGKHPMLEFHAKNTGIRRSRGRFVLITNPDVLFNEALMDLMVSGRLSKDSFYRIDRIDFDGDGMDEMHLEELTEFAKSRVTQIHVRHREEHEPIHIDPTNLTSGPSRSFPFPGDTKDRRIPVIRCKATQGFLKGIHTNGSGDFILATKQAFEEAGGFWERSDWISYLDGFMVCRLYRTGFTQCIFTDPCALYHMDHDRTESRAHYIPPWPDVRSQLQSILAREEHGWNEGNGWGLRNFELPETRFGQTHQF